MVQQIERLITVAEALQRGVAIVKKLRTGGNGEAAAAIEKECNTLAKRIVSVSKGRRRRGIRARQQNRAGNGRFQ
ncbi:hypothetical protein LCGC14_2910900 [marine sediment metagenome]|uniref:Uncharacterized protein n=1 Tax=marine sediment metagenome TaxID=412755 RepID=A0A0F9AHT2_9ZZZZ